MANIHLVTPWETALIQRPPISRATRCRESFPGKLIVPNAPNQQDVSSVNNIPRPQSRDLAPAAYTHLNVPSRKIHPGEYNPANHLRHFSVSSYATQYTQRTQSTLQVIPTRTISTTQHRRGKASVSNSTARGQRTSTPHHYFKRTPRRGSPVRRNRNDEIEGDDYHELGSQETEAGFGFQYAATPSVGHPLKAATVTVPDDLRISISIPTLRAQITPSPILKSKERRCIHISCRGSVKFLEEFAKKLKHLFLSGQKAGAWKVSRVKSPNRQKSKPEIGESFRSTDKRKLKGIPALKGGVARAKSEQDAFSWDQGEKTLRIKNNETGSCVFMVTSAPGNPQETVEIPLPFSYLKSRLFAHSKSLIRSLEEWNRHFQHPPPHWVINFVPKAYLRRGWHLAEEVAEYVRTYGLNPGVDTGDVHRGPWKVEYEAIGHMACLVDEGGECYGDTIDQCPVPQKSGNMLANPGSIEGRERHPSRCWERKEGWDGCRGLVVGIAL